MVPTRGPSHCFHTQRVQGKNKGRKPGGHLESKLARGIGTSQSYTQQTKHDKIEEHPVYCVKKKTCEVIPERVRSPEEIVEAIGHPDEWSIVSQIEGSKHPAKLRPTQPAVVRIFKKIPTVIPIDETILQHREKSNNCQ